MPGGRTAGLGIGYTPNPGNPLGIIPSGEYVYTSGQVGTTTNTATADTARVTPFWVPNPITITKIGAEVTGAGGSGCVIRLGLWASLTTNGKPGALVVDAGTISGTSATVQEITLGSSVSLLPGMYWAGGANQVGTAATVRCASNVVPGYVSRSTIPAAGESFYGYSESSVTGAFGGTFTASPSTNTTPTLHLFVKTA